MFDLLFCSVNPLNSGMPSDVTGLVAKSESRTQLFCSRLYGWMNKKVIEKAM